MLIDFLLSEIQRDGNPKKRYIFIRPAPNSNVLKTITSAERLILSHTQNGKKNGKLPKYYSSEHLSSTKKSPALQDMDKVFYKHLSTFLFHNIFLRSCNLVIKVYSGWTLARTFSFWNIDRFAKSRSKLYVIYL